MTDILEVPRFAKFRGQNIEIPDFVSISASDETLAKSIAERYGIPNYQHVSEAAVHRDVIIPKLFSDYVNWTKRYECATKNFMSDAEHRLREARAEWQISLIELDRRFENLENYDFYLNGEEKKNLGLALQALSIEQIIKKALDGKPYSLETL